MPSNPLLDDINEDHHALLLEKGNLLPKRKEWKPEEWRFTGYKVLITHHICQCGSVASLVDGILSEEFSSLGNYRAINLVLRGFQATPESLRTTVISTVLTAVCPACLPKLGFTES